MSSVLLKVVQIAARPETEVTRFGKRLVHVSIII